MREFEERIHVLGINPCVDVPEETVHALLREAMRKSAPVQVRVMVNGRGPFEATVVKYRGAHRLYLNTRMRREAGVGVGDLVCIDLTYDPVQRMPPMPEALKAALVANRRAREKWRLQPRSRRREVLAYLNSLRSDESMFRNVQKTIRGLLDEGSQ